MERKIKKLFLLFFIAKLFLFNSSFSISSQEIEKQLIISKAYMFLEKGDFVKAGKIVKKLQSSGTLQADGYFIFGEIHFNTGLYQIALNYYEKANKIITTFIWREERYELWWQMIRSHQKLGQFTETLPLLERLSQEAQKTSEENLFDPFLGKVYFEQALTLLSLQKWHDMNDSFLKAIAKGEMKYTSYLFLLSYLANYSQREINFHFSLDQQPPVREDLFHYYYKIWNSLKMTPFERSRFENLKLIYQIPDLLTMINQITNFKKSLEP